MDEHVGVRHLGGDRILQPVRRRVGVLEARSRPELDVQIDVPPSAGLAGAELVVADHALGRRGLDRAADGVELALRERRVDEHVRRAHDEPHAASGRSRSGRPP
jgi:hypothetical protein